MKKQVLKWIVIVLAIVVGAWLIGKTLSVAAGQQESRQDREELEDRVDKLKDQVIDQSIALDEANRRCTVAADCTPVPAPDAPDVDDDVVPIPIPGERGARGLSCIEEIGYPRCRGARGAAGEDSDVAGQPGRDGADSTVPGPRGEKGDKGDTGDVGPQGDRGPAGADGRGVQSVTCEGGQFVVTYTDGTSQPVAGSSCVAAPGNSGETP